VSDKPLFLFVIPAKTGIQAVAAIMGTPGSPLSRGRQQGGYSLSRRLAFPLSNFSLSSAHSGKVFVHSVPGGFFANG
jgi:hypothetical protein